MGIQEYTGQQPDIQKLSPIYRNDPCMSRWTKHKVLAQRGSQQSCCTKQQVLGCGVGGGVPPYLEGAQSHRSNGEARGALLAGAGGEPGVPVLHPTQGGKWEPREQNGQVEKGGKGAELPRGSLHFSSGKIQGNLTGKQPRELPRMGQGTCVGRRTQHWTGWALTTHFRHIYIAASRSGDTSIPVITSKYIPIFYWLVVQLCSSLCDIHLFPSH